MPPKQLRDNQHVQSLLANTQSTHRVVANASIAKVLLELEARYFPYSTKKQKIYDQMRSYVHCIIDLNRLSKQFPQYKPAITNIIHRTKERVDAHDYARVYQPCANDPSHHEAVTYCLPLRKVLPIVWRAINDNRLFCAETDKTPGQKAKAKELRIASFLRCLEDIRLNPVCHHGTRHELAFLLNDGENMIEDESLLISSYLRSFYSKKFFALYDTTHSEQRKELNHVFVSTVATKTLNVIEGFFHVEQEAKDALLNIFLEHGISPVDIQFETVFKNAYQYETLHSNPNTHPIHDKITRIFSEFTNASDQPQRNDALNTIKTWLTTAYQSDESMSDITAKIDIFETLYSSYYYLQGYHSLLIFSGTWNESLISLKQACEDYFKLVTSGTIPAHIDGKTREAGYELLRTIKTLNNNPQLCKDEIENFFWHFFDKHTTKPRRKELYNWLLDEHIREKILLTDEHIQQFTAQEQNGELPVDTYYLNRFILTAIITPPSSWSVTFFAHLQIVHQFIKQHFNQNNRFNAERLMRETYSDRLIGQLYYLVEVRQFKFPELEEEKSESDEIKVGPKRPSDMIVMPEHITNYAEWKNCFNLMTEKNQERFFIQYKPHIINVIIEKITQTHEPFFRFIPAAHWNTFINSLTLKQYHIVKNCIYHLLTNSVSNHITYNEQINLLVHPKMYGVLMRLGKKHREGFRSSLNFQQKDKIITLLKQRTYSPQEHQESQPHWEEFIVHQSLNPDTKTCLDIAYYFCVTAEEKDYSRAVGFVTFALEGLNPDNLTAGRSYHYPHLSISDFSSILDVIIAQEEDDNAKEDAAIIYHLFSEHKYQYIKKTLEKLPPEEQQVFYEEQYKKWIAYCKPTNKQHEEIDLVLHSNTSKNHLKEILQLANNSQNPYWIDKLIKYHFNYREHPDILDSFYNTLIKPRIMNHVIIKTKEEMDEINQSRQKDPSDKFAINRIFLTAILIAPEQWEEWFFEPYQGLHRAFNLYAPDEYTLRNKLFFELGFLDRLLRHFQKPDEFHAMGRPQDMFTHPDLATEFNDYAIICRRLDENNLHQFYTQHKVKVLNTFLSKDENRFADTNVENIFEQLFKTVIPADSWNDFIDSLSKKQLVTLRERALHTLEDQRDLCKGNEKIDQLHLPYYRLLANRKFFPILSSLSEKTKNRIVQLCKSDFVYKFSSITAFVLHELCSLNPLTMIHAAHECLQDNAFLAAVDLLYFALQHPVPKQQEQSSRVSAPLMYGTIQDNFIYITNKLIKQDKDIKAKKGALELAKLYKGYPLLYLSSTLPDMDYEQQNKLLGNRHNRIFQWVQPKSIAELRTIIQDLDEQFHYDLLEWMLESLIKSDQDIAELLTGFSTELKIKLLITLSKCYRIETYLQHEHNEAIDKSITSYYIEQFFSLWKQEKNHKALYHFLLHEPYQNVFIISDSDIESCLKTVPISDYERNRILLTAIITQPKVWSVALKNAVDTFVRIGSIPEQFEYSHQQTQPPQDKKNCRPPNIILHPIHATNMAEWAAITPYLSEDKKIAFYPAVRDLIIDDFFTKLVTITESEQQINLFRILFYEAIPACEWGSFFESLEDKKSQQVAYLTLFFLTKYHLKAEECFILLSNKRLRVIYDRLSYDRKIYITDKLHGAISKTVLNNIMRTTNPTLDQTAKKTLAYYELYVVLSKQASDCVNIALYYTKHHSMKNIENAFYFLTLILNEIDAANLRRCQPIFEQFTTHGNSEIQILGRQGSYLFTENPHLFWVERLKGLDAIQQSSFADNAYNLRIAFQITKKHQQIAILSALKDESFDPLWRKFIDYPCTDKDIDLLIANRPLQIQINILFYVSHQQNILNYLRNSINAKLNSAFITILIERFMGVQRVILYKNDPISQLIYGMLFYPELYPFFLLPEKDFQQLKQAGTFEGPAFQQSLLDAHVTTVLAWITCLTLLPSEKLQELYQSNPEHVHAIIRSVFCQKKQAHLIKLTLEEGIPEWMLEPLMASFSNPELLEFAAHIQQSDKQSAQLFSNTGAEMFYRLTSSPRMRQALIAIEAHLPSIMFRLQQLLAPQQLIANMKTELLEFYCDFYNDWKCCYELAQRYIDTPEKQGECVALLERAYFSVSWESISRDLNQDRENILTELRKVENIPSSNQKTKLLLSAIESSSFTYHPNAFEQALRCTNHQSLIKKMLHHKIHTLLDVHEPKALQKAMDILTFKLMHLINPSVKVNQHAQANAVYNQNIESFYNDLHNAMTNTPNDKTQLMKLLKELIGNLSRHFDALNHHGFFSSNSQPVQTSPKNTTSHQHQSLKV
jgi:hypothetical protein